MKKYFFVLLVYLASAATHAQPGEWTWVHGDATPNQPGNFGTQGISSPTNKPPAAYEGCEWTDHNGNFWIYGGQHTAGNFYADLWKYDPLINEWVWVNGPGTINPLPVYGVQGVPSATNNPGGRGWAPSSWVDNNNNLWMFAGCDQGAADMNNLWMYNISTNEWTWMKGANMPGSPGNPGVIGVPSLTNEPSARHECTCSWIDGSGDLWFFGGYGAGQTDDLWRYSVSTNMWTWVKGDPMVSNPAVYGTMGIPDPANTPGARNSYSRWADKNGNLWLFGGVLYALGSFNDLWKYSIASNEWTWMKGPNIADDAGYYGTQCIEDSLNNPSAHCENRSCWMDSCGNLWTFGGVTATGTYLSKNDLWRYSPVTNNWTWASGGNGTNDPGSFGSIGVSSPFNRPPGRMGSYAWQDANGNLWMGFGQTPTTNSYRNDLWKFVPDPACGGCAMIPMALFSAPHHICPGTCTDFVNLSQFATSFVWSFPGATPSTSVDANPTNICYNTPGSYAVTLIASNMNTSDTLTLSNYITVYPYPAPQGILQNGDTLFANAGAVSYQWYHNGSLIPGATDYFYIAPESGDFNVVATDANGCEVEAAIFDVVAAVESEMGNSQTDGRLEAFPNPVSDWFEIGSTGKNNDSKINAVTIYNMIGGLVMEEKTSGGIVQVPSGNYPGHGIHAAGSVKIDVSKLARGMYWVEVTTGSKTYRMKMVKD